MLGVLKHCLKKKKKKCGCDKGQKLGVWLPCCSHRHGEPLFYSRIFAGLLREGHDADTIKTGICKGDLHHNNAKGNQCFLSRYLWL